MLLWQFRGSLAEVFPSVAPMSYCAAKTVIMQGAAIRVHEGDALTPYLAVVQCPYLHYTCEA